MATLGRWFYVGFYFCCFACLSPFLSAKVARREAGPFKLGILVAWKLSVDEH
jgi:hypothetical protein